MPRERKQISFTGREANNNGWLYAIKWKAKCFGLHMKNDGDTTCAVRKAIADKLGVSVSHIGEDLHLFSRGETPLWKMSDKEYIFDHYRVEYTYLEDEATHSVRIGEAPSPSD